MVLRASGSVEGLHNRRPAPGLGEVMWKCMLLRLGVLFCCEWLFYSGQRPSVTHGFADHMVIPCVVGIVVMLTFCSKSV